ncbi:MAG: hypothetical protein Q7S99_03120 [Parvibaculum sp.]|nr:hypothetical protein [Parvibaculum sp.]
MTATRDEVAAARTREQLARIATREHYAPQWVDKIIEARRVRAAKMGKHK